MLATCLSCLSVASAQDPETGFAVRVIADGSVRTLLGNATVRYQLDAPDGGGDGDGKAATVRSDEVGRCLINGIVPGYYTLEVRAVGYEKREDASVIVVDGAITQVDLVLQLEAVGRTHLRFSVLLAGGVLLIVTIWRGKVRAQRIMDE